MKDQQAVVERLSQFNNRGFTKKQWEIVLEGCGCPKSTHFWTALRKNNMQEYRRVYTLMDMDIHSYAIILNEYLTLNREYVKKAQERALKRKKAQERSAKFRGITFYMINGSLTTEKPEKE